MALKLKLKLKPNPLLYSILQIRPPIRIKKFLENPSSLVLLFPIQLKQMTDEETKEYHLKKLFELSSKSAKQKRQLEEPTEEQNRWIERNLKAPAWTWRSYR